jgi:hypothetical protein
VDYIRKFIIIAVALTALVAGRAYAGGPTDIPDHTGLHQLQVETSLFLIEDFKFPVDDKATIYRDADGYVRVDYFSEGKRVSRAEVAVGALYCAVMARAGVNGYVEKSKRFQVSGVDAPNPAPREGEQGVGVELRSVQSSSIMSISCYQPNYASLPITVQALRQAVRVTPDSTGLALLGPPAAGPVLAEVDPTRAPSEYRVAVVSMTPKAAPAPTMARRPASTTSKSYQSLDQAHRQYVKLVKKQDAWDSGPTPASLNAK